MRGKNMEKETKKEKKKKPSPGIQKELLHFLIWFPYFGERYFGVWTVVQIDERLT